MLGRKTEGSVVCTSCGQLVGVNDKKCLNCGRLHPGLFGFAGVVRKLGNDLGFTKIAMGACLLLYGVALLMRPDQIGMGGFMSMLSPSNEASFVLGASGSIPVFAYDRWWTILSATFLHGSLLHIVFNLMWLRQLGPALADAFGAGRSAILFLVSSMVGFAVTSGVAQLGLPFPRALAGAPLTLGASAGIFGWLGALVFYGRRSGNRQITQNLLWGAALPLFVIGFLFPGIDNWAHFGGFAGGYLLARILDPLRPERIDHVILALVLMLASLLSIIASVVFGLPLLDPSSGG